MKISSDKPVENTVPVEPENRKARPVGYVELVKTNANFRNLWFGQLISAAGDWFNNVALLGLALQLTGSGFAAGMVLLATGLPYFLLIPVAGPIVDRYSRKTVMLLANLAGAGAALTFLLVHDASTVWLLYAGSALLSSTAAFFNPASNAIVPNIVNDDELYPASTLSSSTWGIMVMVGSALGGLVSAQFGREVVFLINAASFILSNFLIWQIKVDHKPAKKVQYSTWGDFQAGLTYLKLHQPIMGLVGCKSGWGLAGGVLVLLTVFGQQIFKAGDSGIGWLYAGRGLGALAGPLLIQPLVGNRPERLRLAIAIAFVVQGGGYMLFGFSAGIGLGLAVFALVLAHSGGGITWVGSSILLQQKVPDEYRGRVFAIDLGLSTLTNSISTLTWSIALELHASPVALALAGSVVFIGYGLAWTYLTSRSSFRV